MISPLFILSVLIMTLFNSIGAYFFKFTMNKIEVFSLKKTFTNVFLYTGILFYILGAVFNFLLLKKYDYSVVYPLTSISTVWTLLISVFFLHENINIYKITAVILIIIGACLICM